MHILEAPGEETPCVVLPLDELFEVRATAAIRLWRGLSGRSLGQNPAELPPARRERLVLALRALDGRLEKASYRDIAEALFAAAGYRTAAGRPMTFVIEPFASPASASL